MIARLSHPEQAPPLGHGFRVDLRVIISKQANALRVPVDSLVRSGDRWAVFRLIDGKAMLTPVEISSGGDRYRSVQSGLKAGDRIVIFPGDTLHSGDSVRP